MKLTGVEGVGGIVRVHWSFFGIGDIPGDPIMEGFTLGDIELLGFEGMGGELLTFGIGDILGDPSMKEFTFGGIKRLGVEGMGDWDSETK